MNKQFDPRYEGRYQIAPMARMLGMDSQRVKRWLFGYSYKNDRGTVERPPVVAGPKRIEPLGNFLDIIELTFIYAFLEKGLSLQKVRKALEEAMELYDDDYPFSRKPFFTDGQNIYLEIKESEEAQHLMQLLSGGQWVIPEAVLLSAKKIDFEESTSLAKRWWPLGREFPVMVDPARGFGSPITPSRSVKTANIFDLYIAEGKQAKVVAEWFSLPVEEVEAAVEFEQKIAA